MAASTPQDAAAEGASSNSGGLLRSLRTLLANLLAVARTRGELLQVELEEEKLRVAGIVIYAVAAAVFLALAAVALTFFVMVLFWDTHRVMAAGVIVLAYAVTGIVCACIAHSRSRVKSKLFSASLAELGKDGARLSQP